MARIVRFPDSFLWGAATASHQVEGDNRFNDWWPHEQAGRLPISGAACDHYRRYEEDFDLAAAWHHNAHRLSIEWSRIEPEQGRWSEAGLAHYAAVIAALGRRKLEPVVTLHHFTNPAWFAERGGWVRRDAADLFRRYVEHVARRLPGVRYWVTINEPTVYLKHGFITGDWPPFRRSAWAAGSRVLRNMARAHVAAFDALHAIDDRFSVGFAHSAPLVIACREGGWGARLAARMRDFMLNDLFFRLIGAAAGRGRRPFDFVGVNYYTRTIVRAATTGPGILFGAECRAEHHADLGPPNQLGWEVYAPGLEVTLRRFGGYGVPVIVTENGLATGDDDARSAFIRDHVRFLARALEGGVDVRGYFYWTLIDNYEWAHGTTARFGLAAIEPETLARIPRSSARAFADICNTNGVAVDEPAPPREISARR